MRVRIPPALHILARCTPTTPSDLKCGSPDKGGFAAENATAEQAAAMNPDAVALLGDEQYEVGKLSDFEQSFDQAWGGLRPLERPAPGNHEYYGYSIKGDSEAAQNGAGYFGYFNGRRPGRGAQPSKAPPAPTPADPAGLVLLQPRQLACHLAQRRVQFWAVPPRLLDHR